MIQTKKIFVLFSLVTLLLLASSVLLANEGELKIKLGGVIIDDQDNFGVNQETYNTYEGFGLSLYDFRYETDAGFGFSADLYNITMNNRNMRFSAYKPGLVKISGYNNQYRRTYDPDGVNFTRRESSGVKGTVQPFRNVKLFGGVDYTDKDGMSYNVYRPVADTVELSTNYTNYSYNFGASGYCPFGILMFEYKSFVFQDDLDFSNDREADQFKVSLFSTYPGYDPLKFSAGYFTRKDKLDGYTTELKTDVYWGAAKLYMKNGWMADYRLILAQSDHTGNAHETDNDRHTLSLTKAWKGMGGIRAGYEYGTSDNSVDRTISNGFLFKGWYNWENKWYFKSKYSVINKDVDDGATLIGQEDRSRHNLSVKYVDKNWGSIKGKVEKRVKEYDELNSKVDYTSASVGLLLKKANLGKLSLNGTYYLGQFENHSTVVNYEFTDHLLSAYIYPHIINKIEVWTGATYYRSQRDIDLEKFSFTFGVSWEFIPTHHLNTKYKAYTYDDLMVASDTYTANIIEFNLIKDLKL
ncbi:hypothetical protein ACFLQG_00385 [Candidatus Zixiibacteriota bacterium]